MGYLFDPEILHGIAKRGVGKPIYEMVEFICDNNREYRDEQGAVRLRLGND